MIRTSQTVRIPAPIVVLVCAVFLTPMRLAAQSEVTLKDLVERYSQMLWIGF